jgi:hypothetical protein
VGGPKESGNEGEYSRCVLYPDMKIKERNLLKLFKKGGRERTMMGVNLTDCKHICKYHNVSPCTTIIC